MRDPATIPVLRLELACASGEVMSRDYLMADVDDAAWFKEPPAWLTNCRKDWPQPQDPVTFYADVAEGHENEARSAIEASGA